MNYDREVRDPTSFDELKKFIEHVKIIIDKQVINDLRALIMAEKYEVTYSNKNDNRTN